ncbi:hypothetical protein RHODO2019_10990 [Rhodococcus antarcticus]|uniref:Uncharacterized protein n=1 Tax=Rhodococcus antarcticus TaxID=2987751 RepID=A0ABY6NWH4_9NOCA|nr:hypothetical protein [Rhodococcus antarcticus]UZJ23731.1 hypothetical protein RHODO2019_10990 [Rhodococcus antarcticus]
MLEARKHPTLGNPDHPYPYVPGVNFDDVEHSTSLCIDEAEFDFHLDAHSWAQPLVLTQVLMEAHQRGYELVPDYEDPGELLDNGMWRRYLVPIEPVNDMGTADHGLAGVAGTFGCLQ